MLSCVFSDKNHSELPYSSQSSYSSRERPQQVGVKMVTMSKEMYKYVFYERIPTMSEPMKQNLTAKYNSFHSGNFLTTCQINEKY